MPKRHHLLLWVSAALVLTGCTNPVAAGSSPTASSATSPTSASSTTATPSSTPAPSSSASPSEGASSSSQPGATASSPGPTPGAGASSGSLLAATVVISQASVQGDNVAVFASVLEAVESDGLCSATISTGDGRTLSGTVSAEADATSTICAEIRVPIAGTVGPYTVSVEYRSAKRQGVSPTTQVAQ